MPHVTIFPSVSPSASVPTVAPVTAIASVRVARAPPPPTTSRRAVISLPPPRWRTAALAVVARAPPSPRRWTTLRRVAARPIAPIIVPVASSTSASSGRRTSDTRRCTHWRSAPKCTIRSRAAWWWLAVPVRLSEAVRWWPARWRTPAEATPRQHDRDVDHCAIQLRLVHVCNRILGVRGCGVQHIGNASIRQELFVDGHLEVLNLAVVAEDLAQVALVDVLGEFLDHDLCAAWAVGAAAS